MSMGQWELWDAEEQLEVQGEVLERLRCFLCQKLVAERHVDFLRSRHILSREDAEDICSHTSSTRRAGRMLDYVAKVPTGLGALLASIRSWQTQDFVAERIGRELKAVQRERGGAEQERHEGRATRPNTHPHCASLSCSDLKETTPAPPSCLSKDYPSSPNSDRSASLETFPHEPSAMGNSREVLISGRSELSSSTLNNISGIGDTTQRELGLPVGTNEFPLSLHSWQAPL